MATVSSQIDDMICTQPVPGIYVPSHILRAFGNDIMVLIKVVWKSIN
jgi:hypothetical protein